MRAARGLVLGLLASVVPPAGAADFYVDPVNGSDLGDGSAANPWRTLQAVVEADLIETRDWESLPYQPGSDLVPVNVGAPVKAGDTLWLRDGYHGEVAIQSAYNEAPITVAAEPGHVPLLRSLLVRSAQGWVLRGLSISPSHAPPLTQATIVEVRDHDWYGPAWDVELHDSDVFTVADASSWGAAEWVGVASSGVHVDADRVTIGGCRVRNVRFGITVGGRDARIQGNLVDGFSADGMRGLGDGGLFESNRIQNNYVGDPPDPNHDDGFQSWSVGPGGVGTGEVRGVTLRGNVFINHLDPANPLRSSMQAVGCFDGFFVDWVVENNVVVTDHWHGISFLGMRDSRIVNNTVIDLDLSSPGPPWIMVDPHKDGSPSQNVVERNNLATDFSLAGINVVADHNMEFTDGAALFVAPPYDLHLLSGAAAVDAGSPDLAPAQDVEGVPRPQGAGFDLGAYERFTPTLSIDDVAVGEGNAGSVSAAFTVWLSAGSPQTVTASFATADGTASAGSDYAAASGALAFAPGETRKTLDVAVLGDALLEADEDFVLVLSGLGNATAGDLEGRGTILDDDAPSLSSNELTHGSWHWGDLAAEPGPSPDVDLYRLDQGPRASYEVVVDGTSGDVGPGLLLERLAADNVTVLQAATPGAAGSSLSLRWENTVPAHVTGQHIRVSNAACAAACGPDDVYRIRAYETTYSIPRFNNSGTQATVVLLQNPTSHAIGGRVHFWDGGGALLHAESFSLAPKGLSALNSAGVAALQGRSGTITVSSDGRYGDLSGKAVALEPATGFTFSSPLQPKPR